MKGAAGDALVIGVLAVVVGGVLWWVFRDLETPVVGLRQVGVVLVVVGAIDVVASAISLARRPDRR